MGPDKQSPSVTNDAIMNRAANTSMNWFFIIFKDNETSSNGFLSTLADKTFCLPSYGEENESVYICSLSPMRQPACLTAPILIKHSKRVIAPESGTRPCVY